MKSILKEIFKDGLRDYEKPAIIQSALKIEEEGSVLYEKLRKTLSLEQLKILGSYDETKNLFHAEENELMYIRGVKIGALMMLEILTTDL